MGWQITLISLMLTMIELPACLIVRNRLISTALHAIRHASGMVSLAPIALSLHFHDIDTMEMADGNTPFFRGTLTSLALPIAEITLPIKEPR